MLSSETFVEWVVGHNKLHQVCISIVFLCAEFGPQDPHTSRFNIIYISIYAV